jgi:hypothetical protein
VLGFAARRKVFSPSIHWHRVLADRVRTRETLLEAMGRALDAVTADDARGFVEYRA